MYSLCFRIYHSVNGVVVTWNPSKVQLGVRFPLNAYLFLYRTCFVETLADALVQYACQTNLPLQKLLTDNHQWFNPRLRTAFPTRPSNVLRIMQKKQSHLFESSRSF